MECDDLNHTCLYGKLFPLRDALKNHQCSCQRVKKQLSSALTKTRDVWTSKKRMYMEEPEHSGHQVLGLAGSHVDGGNDEMVWSL